MNAKFDIIDGTVYVDKNIFEQSQKVDNGISKLVGSPCVNLFGTQPSITTGKESVTIDYKMADDVRIDMDPKAFINQLRLDYEYGIRGHIIIDNGDHHPQDLLINKY